MGGENTKVARLTGRMKAIQEENENKSLCRRYRNILFCATSVRVCLRYFKGTDESIGVLQQWGNGSNGAIITTCVQSYESTGPQRRTTVSGFPVIVVVVARRHFGVSSKVFPDSRVTENNNQCYFHSRLCIEVKKKTRAT